MRRTKEIKRINIPAPEKSVANYIGIPLCVKCNKCMIELHKQIKYKFSYIDMDGKEQ